MLCEEFDISLVKLPLVPFTVPWTAVLADILVDDEVKFLRKRSKVFIGFRFNGFSEIFW